MELSEEFFAGFLNGVMLLCAVMALFWVARVRTKGLTAWLMACAFLLFGALAYALAQGAPLWVRIALSAGLALCLGADIAARASRKVEH
jgi:hypothetical protein